MMVRLPFGSDQIQLTTDASASASSMSSSGIRACVLFSKKVTSGRVNTREWEKWSCEHGSPTPLVASRPHLGF